jgi:SAM-dependent methyltransferase
MEKDFLWLNLRDLPYFRAFLRAVEMRFYQDYELTGPVLDLGCGDGHFAWRCFDRPLDAGLDPWMPSLRLANKTGGYRLVTQAMGNHIPFPDATFNSAVSNSVMEHIPDLDPVVMEMGRVLKPGALFLFCVPNQYFLANLSISNALDKVGLKPLGNAYRSFFNRICRHHHCDTPEVWQARLKRAGFSTVRWWHYFSPEATAVLEWGHYFGLPSLITRKLFGRWIMVPQPWNLALTRALVQKYVDEPANQPHGSYTFYVARREG